MGEKIESVPLCEHHDGEEKEKCDNRGGGKGRVEVWEVLGKGMEEKQ